eukprot:gene11866-8154_t
MLKNTLCVHQASLSPLTPTQAGGKRERVGEGSNCSWRAKGLTSLPLFLWRPAAQRTIRIIIIIIIISFFFRCSLAYGQPPWVLKMLLFLFFSPLFPLHFYAQTFIIIHTFCCFSRGESRCYPDGLDTGDKDNLIHQSSAPTAPLRKEIERDREREEKAKSEKIIVIVIIIIARMDRLEGNFLAVEEGVHLQLDPLDGAARLCRTTLEMSREPVDMNNSTYRDSPYYSFFFFALLGLSLSLFFFPFLKLSSLRDLTRTMYRSREVPITVATDIGAITRLVCSKALGEMKMKLWLHGVKQSIARGKINNNNSNNNNNNNNNNNKTLTWISTNCVSRICVYICMNICGGIDVFVPKPAEERFEDYSQSILLLRSINVLAEIQSP